MAYKSGIMPLHTVEKPPFTIEAPGSEPVAGETRPRRHPKAKDGLLKQPAPGVETVFDLVKWSAGKFANEPAIGTRKLIKLHKETKKVAHVVHGEAQEVSKEWTYFELSPYSYLTYAEYYQLVLQLGSGLRKLGLTENDRLHIFASTR